MSEDLIAFVRARLDEIEALATAATPGPWWSDEDENCWRLHGVAMRIPPQMDGLIPEQVVNAQILKAPKRGTPYAEYWPGAADSRHITMNDPARVLRDVEAKRKIVDAYERAPDWAGREDVRWIAAIDADHPDYKQEWA